MRIIAVAVLAALLIHPSSVFAGPLPANMAGLVATADDLYTRAASIVAQTPRSEMRAAQLASPGGAGSSFYARERSFQDRVHALPPTGELSSVRGQATVRFGQFDNFVYMAVQEAVGACNTAGARANLRVARELLAELHRIAIGRGQPDWNPPGLDAAGDAPSGDRCS
jgi:hypothetical protein